MAGVRKRLGPSVYGSSNEVCARQRLRFQAPRRSPVSFEPGCLLVCPYSPLAWRLASEMPRVARKLCRARACAGSGRQIVRSGVHREVRQAVHLVSGKLVGFFSARLES